jgi:hypothetical protein
MLPSFDQTDRSDALERSRHTQERRCERERCRPDEPLRAGHCWKAALPGDRSSGQEFQRLDLYHWKRVQLHSLDFWAPAGDFQPTK